MTEAVGHVMHAGNQRTEMGAVRSAAGGQR